MTSKVIHARWFHVAKAALAATSIFVMVAAVALHGTLARGIQTGSGAVLAVGKGQSYRTTTEGRLFNRLKSAAGDAPAPAVLERAVQDRHALLKSTVHVRVVDPSGATVHEEEIPLSTYGGLVTLAVDGSTATARIDVDQVKLLLVQITDSYLTPPVHCSASDIVPKPHDAKGNEIGYERIQTGDCILRDGVTYNVEERAQEFTRLVENGGGDLTIQLNRVRGELFNATGRDLGNLKLLSSGRTNFKGSTWARKENIKKALYEHLNGVIIPADSTFAFNDTLGGPVTQGRGWYMALGIFGGSELRPTPGGGICQTSTTTYRAALYAGLPIVEQSNHSLFVTYYEKYGVGLDATIFPGSRDLKFVNDTGHPIVIQAYVDGDDAYVNFLGTPDGRSVTMEGPYFSGENPDYVKINNRAVKSNEIAWVRRVTNAQGVASQEVLYSRYFKGIGNWVRKNWTRQDVAAAAVRVNF